MNVIVPARSSTNTPRLNVAVVGYGTAGQATALALQADGHGVEVFERVPQPGPVGAGFLLQPTGLQALWQLNLLQNACAQATPVTRLHGETTTARAVMDMQYAGLDARLSGWGMQRGALFTLLHEALADRVQRHVGCEVHNLDCQGGRVQDASGGWHGPFDLVVVADGAGSSLREQVSPFRINRPYPWGALWCLLPMPKDWAWPDQLRQRYRLAREMAGLLPVGTRADDGRAMLSFFWSVPCAGFDALADAGSAAWLQALERLWPQARALFADDFDIQGLVRARYRDAIAKRWFNGRALLLGDAAHAMSPQLGQGVNMALLDAVALARHLRNARPLSASLAAFADERRRHLAAYHRWSRWLTPLFQSDHDGMARMRDALFLPMGRLPGSRGQMLRVLTGTQQGWWGRMRLQPAFIEALQACRADTGRPGLR